MDSKVEERVKKYVLLVQLFALILQGQTMTKLLEYFNFYLLDSKGLDQSLKPSYGAQRTQIVGVYSSLLFLSETQFI